MTIDNHIIYILLSSIPVCMEIRKVQISGGSSFIVSLPKKWIKSTNIKKNDPVGLVVQPDGTLLITPNISGDYSQRVWEFEASATTDRAYLLRCLIGAYIAGYTTIRIRAEGRLPPFILGLVREFTSSAIGQEVVEETETAIVIRDLLNPAEMPFENTLRRMSVIVRGMYEDAITSLAQGDKRLAEDVISRDTDVDRLHWLIARQNSLIANDVNLSRKMNVPVSLSEHYFLVSRIIERIADHSTRVAHYSLQLIGKEIDPGIVTMIGEAGSLANDVFTRSMDSLYEEDIKKANATIERIQKLEMQCREISTKALSYDAGIAIQIVHISDSLRRIGDYSADICEAVMNHLVGEIA